MSDAARSVGERGAAPEADDQIVVIDLPRRIEAVLLADSLAQVQQSPSLARLADGFNTAAVYDNLPTILREFHERFPDVELMLREMPTSEQIEALGDGRIQVGIVRLPVDDAAIVTQSIARQSLVLALPEGHR